jgi:hypothetical protein
VSTAFSEGDNEPIPNVKVRDFSIKLRWYRYDKIFFDFLFYSFFWPDYVAV